MNCVCDSGGEASFTLYTRRAVHHFDGVLCILCIPCVMYAVIHSKLYTCTIFDYYVSSCVSGSGCEPGMSVPAALTMDGKSSKHFRINLICINGTLKRACRRMGEKGRGRGGATCGCLFGPNTTSSPIDR